ncbi:serine/threonine protein phosphatase [Leptospira noumeaensis]|uniref:Serine/threonine protein phosphatase n=1 Tax=Leptospira noumeaensis TaxID=2484964 RepID=A0A4R9I9L6_9LEPT|nr:7TM diverse intracellular signaling domain-containing protein [Leptospira noumeaensis]TGK82169.1 serine/threonine protein phosphatase [Leptospira noumeaensis]
MRTLLTVILSGLLFSCSRLEIQKSITDDSFVPQKIDYAISSGSDINFQKLRWTPIFKNNLSLGFQSDHVYLRIKATNQTSANKLILDLGNPHLDFVRVYEEGNLEPIKEGGDFIAHSHWDAFSKSIAFELDWKENETKTLILETKSSSNVSYLIRFYSKETFYLKENLENTILGFFYGTIFIMVIYNLFIYFILKEKAYISYSISIFFNLALQMYLNGILNQVVTLDHPEIHNRIGSIIVTCSAVSGWTFAQQTLNLRELNPWSHKLIQSLKIIVLFYILIPYSYLPIPIAVRLGNVIAQLFVVSVLVVALINYSTGNKQARLFLFGWITLLFGILMYTLMQNGVLPVNLFTIYANQIGSTLEAGILSLALANKINELKEEKANTQALALVTLEEKVRERTKTLDESLNLIKKDLNVAKKIQKTLFSDIKTSDPRIHFHSYYQSMSEVGGDFYDLTQVKPDYYRIFVADATGHGIQAALITMAIKAEYESLKMIYDHPDDLIFHMNQIFINKYSNVQTIFTCSVCDIDLKNKMLFYASAGHPDQIHQRIHDIKLLPRTGKIIGLMDHTQYRIIEHQIEEGDRIFLFTDGIFEQFNEEKELFGEDRLYDILKENLKMSLDHTMAKVLTELASFTEGDVKQDDITFIGCEIQSLS